MENAFSALGIFVFIGVLYFFSENRKAVDWRLIAGGIGLQLSLAFLILGIPALEISGFGGAYFQYANAAINGILEFTDHGSKFLFGPLVDVEKTGFIIAFKVLPTVVFFSALMAFLYHIKVIPVIVYVFSLAFSKVLKISGAESLAASANIFVGQTEAPLIIKPFLKKMTQSEVFCLMVGGMATVAGGVMAAYVGLLREAIPTIGGHLLTASILSAPAAFICAKILIPETEKSETSGGVPKNIFKSEYTNFIDACSRGTTDGLGLALNVGAMLLSFIALVALFDFSLGYVSTWIGFPSWGASLVHPSLYVDGQAQLTFSVLFSWIFYPCSLLLGVSFDEAWVASSLLAKKLILNEFVAYVNLSQLTSTLSERTTIILSYALCGFANFSSIGIQIGGIGSLAPERKKDLAALGLKSVLGGTMAAYMTACVAGLLI